MPIYCCQPKKQNAAILTFSGVACAAGTVLLWLSAQYDNTIHLLRILAILILTFAFTCLIRWGLLSYRYELYEKNLIIVQTVGKKERVVCDLLYAAGIAFYTKSETGDLPVPDRIVNYTVNFSPTDTTRFLYRCGSRWNMLILEPDAHFLDEILVRIRVADISSLEIL